MNDSSNQDGGRDNDAHLQETNSFLHQGDAMMAGIETDASLRRGEDEDSTVRWDDEMLEDGSRFGAKLHPDAHDGKIREEFNELARNNTVNRVKIMVVLMLVAATVLVSVLVWHFTKSDEESDFQVQYNTFARKAVENFMHNMDSKVWTAYTLSCVFTSRFSPDPDEIQGNQRRRKKRTGYTIWPNVTMMDFAYQTKGPNVLANARALFFTPLVTNVTFYPWMAYARRIYQRENIATQGLPAEDQSHDSHTRRGMYRIDENGKRKRENGTDALYFPVWHISPEQDQLGGFLYNEYSEPHRRRTIDHMLKQRTSCMTSFMYNEWDYHSKHRERHREPTSVLFSPIFMDFTRKQVVGAIGIDFDWSMNFVRLLPDNMAGLIVVLESGDGQKHTYRLNGARAEFLGPGDLREKGYDKMEINFPYDMPDVNAPIYRREDNHRRRRSLRVWNVGEDGEPRTVVSNTTDPNANLTQAQYLIRIFPTREFQQQYTSNRPVILCTVVALIFFFTSMTFVIYDCLVENRQAAVMNRALQTSKIVHSLFPATVRERLFTTNELKRPKKARRTPSADGYNGNATVRLKKFLSGPHTDKSDATTVSSSLGEPIADMFPDTTILFADIAGFTAWSSERQPSQVFELLETIYREFDIEAKKYGVFKIETIGDCYVAATGLPDPQADHAIVMARFAHRCLVKFVELTRELELSLGPGTAALGIRIGMHSGAVTAGVLRGEKSRFQLFGDTMNTASRMESSGITNKIQASPETANLLTAGGKEHWITPRADIVTAKGKGEIQTYWVRPRSAQNSGSASRGSEDQTVYTSAGWDSEDEKEKEARDRKTARGFTARGTSEDDLNRLVKWNAAVLEDLLLKVMVHRQFLDTRELQSKKRAKSRRASRIAPATAKSRRRQSSVSRSSDSNSYDLPPMQSQNPFLLVEEITDEVSFATYTPRKEDPMTNSKRIQSIGEAAKEELTFYVACIASMYRNVHFHSFEHAAHVSMSANKLMKKVCARKSADANQSKEEEAEQIDLFFKTFGISSDPLAQFTVVFAALVHDVDHFGITNVELIKEKPEFAERYKNISVAEQNSIHVAWELLMEPDFPNLRKCIFPNKEDRHRFKQLLIHMIIATDIADKDRMQKEKKRWNVAFANMSAWEDEWRNKTAEELATVDVSFKATAVLEQLMLASDIAHTMQHWITYTKWNERLFKERMQAFLNGRSSVDPRDNWYEGEIGFFDFYIIPLAKRLKDCGVFGTAGDEYLGYAMKNRQEWTEKGQDIVAKYLQWVENQEPDGFENTNRIV